ncbi:MAG: flagellar biosynthetic protein FliO [Terriglobales bacterium]
MSTTPSLWHWKQWLASPRPRRRLRRLRMLETLSLGDRRFVAVISVDGRELLVGGTPQSLALLTELEGGLGRFEPGAPRPPRSLQ